FLVSLEKKKGNVGSWEIRLTPALIYLDFGLQCRSDATSPVTSSITPRISCLSSRNIELRSIDNWSDQGRRLESEAVKIERVDINIDTRDFCQSSCEVADYRNPTI
ncbi:2og-fe oxygenase, partial [Moniliophthora roreri]